MTMINKKTRGPCQHNAVGVHWQLINISSKKKFGDSNKFLVCFTHKTIKAKYILEHQTRSSTSAPEIRGKNKSFL